MKIKKLLALFTATLILSSCMQQQKAINSSSAQIQLPQSALVQQSKDSALFADENGNLIANSRAGVSELYILGCITENAYSFFYDLLSGGDYNYKLVISDFKLVYNKQDYTENYRMALDFTVAESEIESLPVGSYKKDFFDIRFETMQERGRPLAYYEKSGYEEMEAVKRLEVWFTSTYSYQIPNIAAPLTNYNKVTNYICNFYGNGVLSFEDFVIYAEQDFGIKPYEITDWSRGQFYIDDSGKKMVQAGGLGGGVAYKVINCEYINGKAEVTIQFFGDYAKVKPSHLVKYFFDGTSFCGYETLKHSIYAPVGFSKNPIAMYGNKIESLEQLRALNPIAAAIAEGDFQKLSENDSDYTPDLLQAIEGFEVKSVTDIYADEYAESIIANINISYSNNPNYPEGEHTYEISTGILSSMQRINDISLYNTPALNALSLFIKSVKADGYSLEGLNSSNWLTEYIILRLYRMHPQKSSATKNEIADYAEKYFGLSNYEPKGIFDEEGGLYTVSGHGGGNVYYNITSTNGTPELPEITVQFYADKLKLVRSHEIRYTLQLIDGDYKFVSAEILNESEFAPGGYSM